MKEVQVIKASKDRVIRNNTLKFNKLRVAPYCRVSTGSEEQKNSYESQMKYYRDMIEQKDEWELVDIYADEAISGTQVYNRVDFQRMINDAKQGKIDLIITKSISRFARNTLDTLKFVRSLKEKNVGIIFEKENINTLTMNGELLLVILSSIAQQESESLAGNVKIGLKMKMSRGELVGFNKCLGYNYDKESKSIYINEKEAEIIKYIFDRYICGAGTYVIAKELTNLEYKTPKGNKVWSESVIRGIIKNEKYKGDLLLGKTFTVDPISHKRLSNLGESEKYYVENHHEAIVSKEVWEKAQAVRKKRYNGSPEDNRRGFSKKHTFSSIIKCGYCDSSYVRRTWHSGSNHEKNTWSCIGLIKKGKKVCPESHSIDERILEKAFVKAYSLLVRNNDKILEFIINTIEEVLKEENGVNAINEKIIAKAKAKQKYDKLIDLKLEDNISEEIFNNKKIELGFELSKIDQELQELEDLHSNKEDYKIKIKRIKEKLINLEEIDRFDKEVFECIIEKIIIGWYNEDEEYEPDKITFILKSGESMSGFIKTTKNKNIIDRFSESDDQKKNKKVCSNLVDEVDDTCSNTSNESC